MKATKSGIMVALEDLWPAMIAGDANVVDLFAVHPRVSHPPDEDAEGREGLVEYLDGTHRWLARQAAAWRPVATTATTTRVVNEGVLVLERAGKEIALPVATVADLENDRVSWLRIYHSMWPLEGSHTLRSPLLPERHDISLSGAVRVYQNALSSGDLDAILSAFRPDGCAREPSGGAYTYCGKEKLREFYGRLFSGGGGIGLEHCTITDDGLRSAIEYNAVRWGQTAMPPQAGVAVYERGSGGLLAEARIYDDVDPPV